MVRKLFQPLCLGAALITTPLHAEADRRTLARFDESDRLRWQTVNDGVMGGRSQGGFELRPEGMLRFSGEISLENNGGFSSIRSRRQPLRLKGYDGLALRVRGDGRTYKVSLRTANTSRWIAYWAELPTVRGEWIEARISFDEWVPTSFGRTLRGPALDVAGIDSIGFMLYDKQDGPFALDVTSIAAYRGQPEPTAAAVPGAGSTIGAKARAAGTFTTLLAAAEAAGLFAELTGPGPLTVFAPTDAAFAALPEGEVAALLEPQQRARLRTILRYHIVPGEVRLAAVVSASRLGSAAGQGLRVDRSEGAVTVAGGTVLTPDIACSNGVIHVIDRVLIPELDSLAGVAQRVGTFQTLLAAAQAAGLADELAEGGPWTVFAPTDDAFAALPPGVVAELLQPERRAALVRLLEHHIVKGRVSASQALSAGSATTRAGTRLELAYAEGAVRADGVALAALDVPAANGVIHVLSGVLVPPPLEDPRGAGVAGRAVRLIEQAIDRGAPLFNQGRPDVCRAIYEVTITALLELGPGLLPSEIEGRLRKALAANQREESRHEGAWILRRALDATYRFLLKVA